MDPVPRRRLKRSWIVAVAVCLLLALDFARPSRDQISARALARRELDRIDERLGKRLAPPSDFDTYTEAHLRDVRERISKALAAAYAVPPKG